ncbi:MAG TPA: NUDIX hydrolase, partial [Verrucomicrobiae bacterium]|nr:NUDIX hydrolase [Verrucomicrobiae bacterium]
GLTESEFLAQYNPAKFERPSVTVDMLIFRWEDEQLKVLMIKRGDHPCIGQWALPGGFVNMDESLEDAAARELQEETGVENVYLEQLYTFGDVGRDPRTRIISTVYMALLEKEEPKVQAGDDAAEAGWFTVEEDLLDEVEQRLGIGLLQVERKIRLRLNKGEINIAGEIKTIAVEKAEKTLRWTCDLVTSQGIAFDHAKLIHYGLEKLATR